MAKLNIVSENTGDYNPWVKYNTKAGRWYVKTESGEQEVSNPTFIADFENIKTGWIFFAEGQAPSKVWDESLSNPAPRPDDKHKRGFEVTLFSKTSFGGLADLSSSSMHLCGSINDLYDQYDSLKAQNPGKLPVVKFTGSTPMKDKMGTNYKPNFVIEKWVDRPAEMSAETQTAAAPAPLTVVPTTTATSEF